MNIFYELDIATCALSIILLFIVVFRKSYVTFHRRLFVGVVLVNIISIGFEILAALTWEKALPKNLGLYAFINTAYEFCHATFFFVLVYYFISKIRNGKLLKQENIILAILYTICSLFILTNPLHKQVFFFDDNLTCVTGIGETILSVLVLLSLGYCFALTLYYRQKLKKFQIALNVVYFISLIAAISVEIVTDWTILIESFVTVVVAIMINVIFDNPYQYFISNTTFFNEHAFALTCNEKLKKGTASKIVFFTYHDFDLVFEKWGRTKGFGIVNDTLKTLTKEYGRFNIFSLGRSVVVVDIKNSDPETEIKKMFEIASIISNECSREFKLEPYFGVIDFPKDVDNTKDLIDSIYLTLFDGKIDQYISYFDKSLLDAKRRENYIVMRLHDAIDNDGFEMNYQPLYNWKKNQHVGLEALIRMKHKKGEEDLGPSEFIPIAEKNGLIFDIDEIVFEKVCRFIRNTNIKDYGVKFIDVNLSLYKLMDPTTVNRYFELASRYDVDPSFINLEITETAEGDKKYLASIKANIARFREKGFKFSLDDYGSGYSTVIYMAEMDTSLVKIDASILWNAIKNKKYYTVLENCVRLVYCFDKECLAEGVETEEMVNILKKLGVEYFQGYYYSKPLPEKELLKFLKTNNHISLPSDALGKNGNKK